MVESTTASRPRVAVYSHDTMGIGHMRRNLLIAQALAAAPISATVLLIAGAREASAFAMPDNVDCLTLPSLFKTSAGHYRSRAIDVELPELISLRGQTIAAALASFRPDVLIVDKEPRGACGELDPVLRQLGGDRKTKLVLGLRDVLDEPAVVRREWQASGNERVIAKNYDAVWVYGDPTVYDLLRDCEMSRAVRGKATFTGYLDACERVRRCALESEQDPQDRGEPAEPFVLCTVGGGQDGVQLADACVAATLPHGLKGVLITGPCMPRAAQDRIRRAASIEARWRVYEFHPEPCRLLARAERVVAMGGYNTVSEILGFAKPALVAPRISPRREQWIRAERMAALGLFDVVATDDVTPQSISRWLAKPLPTTTEVRTRIDLNGLARIPRLFRSLVANPSDRVGLSVSSAEKIHAAV